MADDQPWNILHEKAPIYGRSGAFVRADRRLDLLTIEYQANKNATLSSTSSTISISDFPNLNNTRSSQTIDALIVINLERIHYIQRGGSTTSRRSARNDYSNQTISQISRSDHAERHERLLEIFYSTENPRSDYLYKSVSFQLFKPQDEFNKWLNALYTVIDVAKNLCESARRNRWILREHEKLRNSSKGLTFDSINGWFNSHLGFIGERKKIQNSITAYQEEHQTKEITDSIFKSVYTNFHNEQQEDLIKTLMSDLIEQNKIHINNFAMRITNKREEISNEEIISIRNFIKVNSDQTEIPLHQCIEYLWSDANSIFDPISRTKLTDDMNQPLNHYWISSSHNTYLAKTQIFNPASHHCYIQALLNGCRCIEIDVVDSRPEPEVTHRNTPVNPISLRDVLEAIHDYAFVASEYPLIISIENHCSSEQRSVMAKMFIEILGDYLLQSPLHSNETHLPSPNELKRKIILKDSKVNSTSLMGAQTTIDPEEIQDVPPPGIEGHLQLFDLGKQKWIAYKYSLIEDHLFLAKDDDNQMEDRSDENFIDEDGDDNERHEQTIDNSELTQVWYHGNISHQDARTLLLSNAGYEIGTFLVRKSSNKHCFCISFLALNSEVKSIEVHESQDENSKHSYSLSEKQFDSIPDLVSHYRTYDFAEIFNLTKQTVYRLGRPLPRPTWKQELERQPWYQPNLSRQQAVDLLNSIREEMTFLIRESSRRTRQGYSLSVFVNNAPRHIPIYRDGEDLMLMSNTFTSLIELVEYFYQKPLVSNFTLKKPAKPYEEFLNDVHRTEIQDENEGMMMQRSLDYNITLKVTTLKLVKVDKDRKDRAFVAILHVQDEHHQTQNTLLTLKFDLLKDIETFLTTAFSSRTQTNRSIQDSTVSINSSERSSMRSHLSHQSLTGIQEFSQLIVYCQGVKLKDLYATKASDLLAKPMSFKEMISLNSVKATAFCTDMESMISFNQSHFTRVYPDFSKKSWNSYNFEPHVYWLAGCQMIALNFQMPDRPMHINAGRFGANGGCGYVLMPSSIRFPRTKNTSLSLKLRIVAVRHIRTIQAKSIVKIHVKVSLIKKQKTAENPTFTAILNGPCGVLELKHASKHHDQWHKYYKLKSEDKEVDLIYFEVLTENQEFCGQSVVPLASLRTGIRSVQLYDKFNERLEMSAILIDIHPDFA